MVGYYGQSEIYIKRKHVEAMMWSLLWWLALLPGVVLASLQEDTAVHIFLRTADGLAVAGETVILERLPEDEPVLPTCTTDAAGHCTWYVRRGLYQVLFTRPLDDISALAVAEGGLQGLGITVGDEAITYHFTFHSDGRVYFDTTPDADRPTPFIPVGDTWQGGTVPTAAPPDPAPTATNPFTRTMTGEPTPTLDTAVPQATTNSWRLLLFIATGLVLGGGFHWWSRHRQQHPNHQSQIVNRQSEQSDA